MPGDATARFAASSVGAALAEAITLPIDCTKVRLQVQKAVPPGSAAAQSPHHYTGMFDALLKIGRTEGLAGLCKGMFPAQVRQVSYSSITLVLYEPIRNAIAGQNVDASQIPFWKRLLSAGTAGGIGIAIMNPTEVIKTQMQANTERLTMAGVARNVYSAGGLAGFWAGVQPNVARTFLVNAAELGTYDQAKNMLINDYGMKEGAVAHVSASGIAGFTSATVSTPVDVVKTRLMAQAGQGAKEYSGMVEALFHPSRSILAKEGVSALYKGFTPIFWRKIIWCSVFFVSYEKLRAAIGNDDVEEQ